jgi:hypothetical protein
MDSRNGDGVSDARWQIKHDISKAVGTGGDARSLH